MNICTRSCSHFWSTRGIRKRISLFIKAGLSLLTSISSILLSGAVSYRLQRGSVRCAVAYRTTHSLLLFLQFSYSGHFSFFSYCWTRSAACSTLTNLIYKAGKLLVGCCRFNKGRWGWWGQDHRFCSNLNMGVICGAGDEFCEFGICFGLFSIWDKELPTAPFRRQTSHCVYRNMCCRCKKVIHHWDPHPRVSNRSDDRCAISNDKQLKKLSCSHRQDGKLGQNWTCSEAHLHFQTKHPWSGAQFRGSVGGTCSPRSLFRIVKNLFWQGCKAELQNCMTNILSSKEKEDPHNLSRLMFWTRSEVEFYPVNW